MSAGFAVWAAITLYALAWLPVAYFIDQTFWPGQMLARYQPGTLVVPTIADFFIWADIFWLPWILRLIVNKHYRQWSRGKMITWGVVGLVLAYLFQEFIVLGGKYPATLGDSYLGTSVVGWMHIPYMGAALAILGLYVFHSPHSPVHMVTAVAIGLVVQILLDLHVVMFAIQRFAHFDWYPPVLAEDPRQATMIIIASLAILGVSAYKVQK